MSRKDKRDDWDNGMTIAPMNGDELPKYRRAIYLNSERRPKNKREKSDITRKEQRAMIRAMFEVMLPRVLIVLQKIADSDYYKKDYENNTSVLLYDNVDYNEAKTILWKIIDSKEF